MHSFPDSGELAQALLEALPDALVVVDSAGLIVGVNAHGLELLGYDEMELLGQSVELLVPEQLRPAHRLARRAFAQHPSRRAMAQGRELKARKRDGSELSVQIALNRVDTSSGARVLAVMRETPDHVRAVARALYELEMVLERLPDPVAIHIEGAYAYVNSAWQRVLLYGSANELLGRNLLDGVHPDDRELVQRRQSAHQAGCADATEVRWLAKDGSVVALDVPQSIDLLYRGQQATLVVAHDVRERRRLEAALALGERLVTVGTLAAGAGHEINNPLQCVSMNLELLRNELQAIAKGSAPVRAHDLLEMTADALHGAERIGKIVLGLQTFARGERERLVELDLASVLELSFNLTRNELRHRLRLDTDLQTTPRLLADESRLAQVFINLLLNAAQAMAHRPADQNVLRVSTWTNERGQAVVELRDNGPGMTDAVRSRVFEPFFTTKPIGQGTGLGLSIAYNIVTSLGGLLECESEPGKGASFRVVLPTLVATAHTAGARRLDPAARRARILVAEDETIVASLLERALKSDYDVEIATDGAQALALLLSERVYDVVLCDLMMPNLTGQEVYARATRERPQLAGRFVFMTGGTTSVAAEAFLAQIPNAELDKPFSVPGLRGVIDRALLRPPRSAAGSE
ncbi:MAG TPA: PAS domain S-box protein [Polyangiaceae bacterium]|nr:PAS domain S-box protein [Polyangiaceae bacterium]